MILYVLHLNVPDCYSQDLNGYFGTRLQFGHVWNSNVGHSNGPFMWTGLMDVLVPVKVFSIWMVLCEWHLNGYLCLVF